jgi:hypothetical protein
VRLPSGWERWLRVAGHYGTTTPFQRPREYTAALHGEHFAEAGDAGPDPDNPDDPGSYADHDCYADQPGCCGSARSRRAFRAAGSVSDRNDQSNGPSRMLPALSPTVEDRDAELSDLVVFDFLTQNTDRWGGGNANVLTRGGGADRLPRQCRRLSASARPDPSSGLMDARLPRRAAISAGAPSPHLRAFDIHAFANDECSAEPCAPNPRLRPS